MSEPLDAIEQLVDERSEAVEEVVREQAVRTAISRFLELPPAQRSCVILKDVLGHSLDDAGKLLGMTVPAVKAALHRGRLRLAALHTDAAPSASVVASPILAHYLELFNARDWGLIHPRRALRSVDQRGARF